LKLKFGVLPDVWGVCLPEEAIFLSVETQQSGLFLDLKFHSYKWVWRDQYLIIRMWNL